MNKKELEAFAKEAAKSFKTEKDLSDFSRMLKKVTIEAALNAELDDHLGYDKYQSNTNKNSRNGTSSKSVHAIFQGCCRILLLSNVLTFRI